MNDTPTPRTYEWETYCDECYYHMWRVRRKNERGFNDGFHVQNGEGARQLVELLNKQDEALSTVTEQRDEARREAEKYRNLMTNVKGWEYDLPWEKPDAVKGDNHES